MSLTLRQISLPCLAELGLGQECDGIVQHEENVLAAYPANGSSELVSIDMLPGHGPPFSPVCWLLVYYPILSRSKEPRWDTTVGFAGANVRMSSSPARATKSMCASVARPGRRASARPLRTRITSSDSLSSRTSLKRMWPALSTWRSRTIRKLPASPQLCWILLALSRTKPEDSSSLRTKIQNC